MTKFRKESIVVEAIQWTGKSQRIMFDFLTNNTKINESITLEEDTFRIDLVNGGCQVGNLIIKTQEGDMKADIGDYIIKDTNNKFYPCKPDLFKETYELIEE